MSTLAIRFIGIICFVDGREGDSFVKRVLLPNDQHAEHRGGPAHIPYIEVDLEDLGRDSKIEPSKVYTRGGRTFHRYDVDGERISIKNAGQGNGRLVVLPPFSERIPSMTLVCPDCPPNPKSECFAPAPPRDLAVAYFDIRTGFLTSGPVEEEETRFEEGSNWPTRRLARWAQLDMSFQGESAEILLEQFDGSGRRTIPLKRSAYMVTIGNQMEDDIEERTLKTNNEQEGHFSMYYDLGDAKLLPKKRPRPTVAKTALRGCAPMNWP